jgi:hypothetical protein
MRSRSTMKIPGSDGAAPTCAVSLQAAMPISSPTALSSTGVGTTAGTAETAVTTDTIVERVNGRWQELRAVDIVLAELSEELADEDLLHAEVRELWADGKQTLEELVEGMAHLGVEIARDEPPAELVERLREIAKREIER